MKTHVFLSSARLTRPICMPRDGWGSVKRRRRPRACGCVSELRLYEYLGVTKKGRERMRSSVWLWTLPFSLANGVAETELDACIVRFANARQACYGSPCGSCISALDDIAADCLAPPCNVRNTYRGSSFVHRFQSYRYADVGRQCLRSVQVPKFEHLEDYVCGDIHGSVRRTSRITLRACENKRAHFPRTSFLTPFLDLPACTITHHLNTPSVTSPQIRKPVPAVFARPCRRILKSAAPATLSLTRRRFVKLRARRTRNVLALYASQQGFPFPEGLRGQMSVLAAAFSAVM